MVSIVTETIRTSAVLGLRLVVQAGSLLLIARLLGPERFGVFSGVAALAVLMGSLSTAGMHLILLEAMSRDASKRDCILAYAIPSILTVGSLLLVIYGMMIIHILRINEYFLLMFIVGISELLVQPFILLRVSEWHALGKVSASQLLQLTPLLLRLMVIIFLSLFSFSTNFEIYIFGYILSSLIVCIFCGYLSQNKLPAWRQWRLPRREQFSNAFGFAAINVSKAAPAELDKTMALQLLSTGSSGIYMAGSRVVGAISLPIIAMTLSVLPHLFRNKDKPNGKQLIKAMFSVALIYGVFLMMVVWFAAPKFNFLFGENYNGIADVIQLLCFSIPALALRLVAGNTLMAMGKPWMRVFFELIGMSVMILSGIILVCLGGAKLMPFSLIISEWTMAFVGIGLILRLRRSRGL